MIEGIVLAGTLKHYSVRHVTFVSRRECQLTLHGKWGSPSLSYIESQLKQNLLNRGAKFDHPSFVSG